MVLKDYVQIFVSLASFLVALIVYVSSKKRFLVDLAHKRAEKVNGVFNIARTGTKVAGLNNDHYIKFWTDIISEIIISKNILEKLSSKPKVLRYFFDVNDIQYIFWEQLHTTIRMHFKSYTDTYLIADDNDDENTIIRKQQIKDIINTYLIL